MYWLESFHLCTLTHIPTFPANHSNINDTTSNFSLFFHSNIHTRVIFITIDFSFLFFRFQFSRCRVRAREKTKKIYKNYMYLQIFCHSFCLKSWRFLLIQHIYIPASCLHISLTELMYNIQFVQFGFD